MQQGQHYHRFGYQPFGENASPQASRPQEGFNAAPYSGNNGSFDEGPATSSGGIASLISSPLVMTGALIAAAAIFAGILMVSYPSSDDIPQPIPIVQADPGPLKSAPEDAGGMEIANADTTVFEAVEGSGAVDKPVENLLESAPPAEEEPMSKEELLAKLKTQTTATTPEADEVATAPEAAKAEDIPEEPAQTALAPKTAIPLPRPEKAAGTATDKVMHEPGTSPDTLAFVRSVLEQKDEKKAAAVASVPKPQEIYDTAAKAPAAAPLVPVTPQAIEPASGTAEAAPKSPASSAGGTHFVQVVSVPSRSAAEAEWAKLEKSLSSVLSGAPHRIQEANLGEKGVYYRVQLGPYAESDARSLCDQVKAQKPGGCLVVR